MTAMVVGAAASPRLFEDAGRMVLERGEVSATEASRVPALPPTRWARIP